MRRCKMILIYSKNEVFGIRADRFVLSNYNKGVGKVKIYCNGDLAFAGLLKAISENATLCDEFVRGLKSEITAEFEEVEV